MNKCLEDEIINEGSELARFALSSKWSAGRGFVAPISTVSPALGFRGRVYLLLKIVNQTGRMFHVPFVLDMDHVHSRALRIS